MSVEQISEAENEFDRIYERMDPDNNGFFLASSTYLYQKLTKIWVISVNFWYPLYLLDLFSRIF